MSADKLQVQALVRIAKPSHLTVSKIAVSGTTATVTHDAASGAAIQVGDTFSLSNFGYVDSIQPPKLEDKTWTVTSVVGATSFTFNPTTPVTAGISDATYTMLSTQRGLVSFWPASSTNYNKREAVPTIDSSTNSFKITSDPMTGEYNKRRQEQCSCNV